MADDWGRCRACGSRRRRCDDADQCCDECRSTAGRTHTAAAAQDTADPADGLRGAIEALARDYDRTGAGITANELRAALEAWPAARQRPTRQADTDRAVVEAVEALAAVERRLNDMAETANYLTSSDFRRIIREVRATLGGAE